MSNPDPAVRSRSPAAGKPSAPTNLTKHHAVDIGLPIGCGGAPVYPGDRLVGDGVVVIPAHLAVEIAEEAAGMEAFEDFVLLEVQAGRPVIGTYPPNEDTLARLEAYKRGEYTPSATDAPIRLVGARA